MDAISRLPDEVLGRILSFLFTKQAASTSVLSKRWKNVFALVSNLDLDDRDSVRTARRYRRDNSTRFMDFVENLLNLQSNSSIKKLSLKSHVGVRDGVNPTRVESWICNVLGRGVVDLDLFITLKGKSPPLPWLIFESKTLVKLRLGHGFTIKLPKNVSLPMLKSLCLNSVAFDEDVNTLLSRCPLLEEFDFEELDSEDQQRGQWSSSLSSPSLKRVRIRLVYLPEILFDFPNLVYFELSCEVGSKYPNVKLDSLVEARLNLRVEPTLIFGARHVEPTLIFPVLNW